MSQKKKRGFACMSPEKQREIAAMGGKAAHENKAAHEFTSAEARKAGKIGGAKVSEDRKHMAAIGRRGGQARAKNAKQKSRAEGASAE